LLKKTSSQTFDAYLIFLKINIIIEYFSINLLDLLWRPWAGDFAVAEQFTADTGADSS
jgi:hypothetical protein